MRLEIRQLGTDLATARTSPHRAINEGEEENATMQSHMDEKSGVLGMWRDLFSPPSPPHRNSDHEETYWIKYHDRHCC